jgi:peptide/nickel transport system ATP-binding protein
MSGGDAGAAILEIEGLRVRTSAGILLIDDVSLTLRPGEVVGLIGESGAGKSTLGLAAMGYVRAGCAIAGGRILFRGEDVMRMAPAARRRLRGARLAYVAQSAAASFNPAIRLIDQVCEIPIRRGLLSATQARAQAVALFRELDLPDPETIGARYPHQVSGGQLQRLMAAMAMAGQPEIVVFDEPTTALDVTTQLECLAAFRRLIRDRRAAALYISHDLSVVAQLADRIMVLRRGRTIETGDTRQILLQPREDYTRRLVAGRAAGFSFAGEAKREEPPVLALDHVSAGYSGAPKIIDDVSLELRRGETFALVGESGSGKSTLARIVTGLLAPGQGDVRLAGVSLPARLRDRDREQLRRVQMIHQTPDVALNPRQTLLDIIGRPAAFYFNRSRQATRQRVIELLRQLDLPESFVGRRPAELSGGQKQRVAIARALAAEPEVIICDEVTSALDQLVAEEILRLLKRLQAELGIAYLFITHDLGVVERIADKVAVMQAGRIVAAGETARVFAPPRHPYTELLLSSVPEMRPEWLDEALARRADRPAA